MEKQRIINFFVLVTVLCHCFSNSNAQLNRDNWLLGTNFGYTQEKDRVSTAAGQGDQIIQEGGIQMHGAYFIQNNHSVGLFLMYHLLSEKTKVKGTAVNNVNYNLRTEVFSVGAFGRSYKIVKKNKLAFFAQLSLSYDAGMSVFSTEYPAITPKVTPIGIDGDIKGFTAAIRPGMVYFLTNNLGIELTFGKLAFVHERIESSFEGRHLSKDVSSGINTDFSVSSLAIGISFYIPKQKH